MKGQGADDIDDCDGDAVMRCEAFVFQQLIKHLASNPSVQNIELMNLSGFCRNCLAKWYFLGASKSGLRLTYDQALEKVYGVKYAEYKATYQVKATKEQLLKFKQETAHHSSAKDLDLGELQQHIDKQPFPRESSSLRSQGLKPLAASQVAMSDVCCESVSEDHGTGFTTLSTRYSSSLHSIARDVVDVKVGVLTVSDRAYQKVYQDRSGPLILSTLYANSSSLALNITSTTSIIVPDEIDDIKACLQKLCTSDSPCDLVFSTGGTGIGKRDVTPEATLSILDSELKGIPELLRRSTWDKEPLSVLSRAVAGVKGRTLIVNLPGRPRAVEQWMQALLPALHGLTMSLKQRAI